MQKVKCFLGFFLVIGSIKGYATSGSEWSDCGQRVGYPEMMRERYEKGRPYKEKDDSPLELLTTTVTNTEDANQESQKEGEGKKGKKERKHKNRMKPLSNGERKEREKKLKEETKEETVRIADGIYFYDYGQTTLDEYQDSKIFDAQIALKLLELKKKGPFSTVIRKVRRKGKFMVSVQNEDILEQEIQGVALTKLPKEIFLDKDLSFQLIELILNHIEEKYHQEETVLYKIPTNRVFIHVENNEEIMVFVKEGHKAKKLHLKDELEAGLKKDHAEMNKIVDFFIKKMKKVLTQSDRSYLEGLRHD